VSNRIRPRYGPNNVPQLLGAACGQVDGVAHRCNPGAQHDVTQITSQKLRRRRPSVGSVTTSFFRRNTNEQLDTVLDRLGQMEDIGRTRTSTVLSRKIDRRTANSSAVVEVV
jgi:hypothetical protein